VTAVFLNARTVFHLKASIGCLLLTHVNKGTRPSISLRLVHTSCLLSGRYKTGLFFSTLLSIYLEETAPVEIKRRIFIIANVSYEIHGLLRAEDSSQRACSQRGIPKPVSKNRSMSRSDAPRNGNREKCARRNAHTDPTCPPYRARRKESRSDWQSC
ncbi:hypothetical protein KUCAC02_032478, partial [Chaenocephalus aceratus]